MAKWKVLRIEKRSGNKMALDYTYFSGVEDGISSAFEKLAEVFEYQVFELCVGEEYLILLSFDASCIRNRFRRRAFVTTQKLERLIAAAPNIGFSFQPNSGIHTPAASGIPMIL